MLTTELLAQPIRIAISCSVKSVEASNDLILSISFGEKYLPCDLRITPVSLVFFCCLLLNDSLWKRDHPSTPDAILEARYNVLANQNMPRKTPEFSEKMCIPFALLV
jgi:hypothetical protein